MTTHIRPLLRARPRPTPDNGYCGSTDACGAGDSDSDTCYRENGDQDTSCEQYAHAMVCINGGQDVTCSGEIYRGCHYGGSDLDGGTDYCCAGSYPFLSNDNIDHASCMEGDAPWGGTCIFLDSCWSKGG